MNLRMILKSSLLVTLQNNFKKGLYITDLNGQNIEKPKIIFYEQDSSISKKIIEREIILLRHLELMQVSMIDSINSIINSSDKFIQLSILAKNGLPVPNTVCSPSGDFKKIVPHSDIRERCVTKYLDGCRGEQIFLSNSKNMLRDISGCLNHDLPYLFQEYIEYSKGRSLRVEVINNKICSTYMLERSDTTIQSNYSYDENSKYFLCKNVTGKFPEAEDLALKTTKCIGLGISGVDLLFQEDGSFTICEVNSMPGLEWGDGTNISAQEAIIEMVYERLEIINNSFKSN